MQKLIINLSVSYTTYFKMQKTFKINREKDINSLFINLNKITSFNFDIFMA